MFKLYPDIKQAYELALKLGQIFRGTRWKDVAYTKLAQWYRKVEETRFKVFATVARTIEYHYQTILNYFDNRSTNTAAESFNAKIKEFRRVLEILNFSCFGCAKFTLKRGKHRFST